MPPAAQLVQGLDDLGRMMPMDARTSDGMYGAYWQGPVDPSARPCSQPGHAECGNATGAVPQISALELLAAVTPGAA